MPKPRCTHYIKVGDHKFTGRDVARVRRGVHLAVCRGCNGTIGTFIKSRFKKRDNCPDCKKTRDRLLVLEAHMKETGEL